MNKTILSSITFVLAIGIGIIFFGSAKNNTDTASQSGQNVEVRDGVQYITVEARGGYSPEVTNAKAGIPTKLIMKTNGTYDCSASLVIKSIGYQKILPQTGEEIIDLGTPQADTPLRGVCGMGMYNFLVNFS
jgi:plastocyanin domain-containing protein